MFVIRIYNNTALAFCNYSKLQQRRRDLLKPHTLPRSGASRAIRLNQLIHFECQKLVAHINQLVVESSGSSQKVSLDIRLLILKVRIVKIKWFLDSHSFNIRLAAMFSMATFVGPPGPVMMPLKIPILTALSRLLMLFSGKSTWPEFLM